MSRAVALGRALAVSTKVELGEVLGRSEVGVVAILDEGFDGPLREAALLSELHVPRGRSGAKLPRSANSFDGGSMSQKLRVYEVARDLGMDNKTLVSLLQSNGVPDVRNHMSAVGADVIERIKRQLEKPKASDARSRSASTRRS